MIEDEHDTSSEVLTVNTDEEATNEKFEEE